MGSVPVLRPREVVALLERLGFVEARQRGSHKQFRHADGRIDNLIDDFPTVTYEQVIATLESARLWSTDAERRNAAWSVADSARSSEEVFRDARKRRSA